MRGFSKTLGSFQSKSTCRQLNDSFLKQSFFYRKHQLRTICSFRSILKCIVVSNKLSIIIRILSKRNTRAVEFLFNSRHGCNILFFPVAVVGCLLGNLEAIGL